MQLYYSRINEVVRLNKELSKKQRSSEFRKKAISFLDFYEKLEKMEEVQDMIFELENIEIIEEPVKSVIEPLVEVLTFSVIKTIRMRLSLALRGVKSIANSTEPFRIIGYG